MTYVLDMLRWRDGLLQTAGAFSHKPPHHPHAKQWEGGVLLFLAPTMIAIGLILALAIFSTGVAATTGQSSD
jgi:hypothetical protein